MPLYTNYRLLGTDPLNMATPVWLSRSIQGYTASIIQSQGHLAAGQTLRAKRSCIYPENTHIVHAYWVRTTRKSRYTSMPIGSIACFYELCTNKPLPLYSLSHRLRLVQLCPLQCHPLDEADSMSLWPESAVYTEQQYGSSSHVSQPERAFPRMREN